jgi:hypothetical protein
LPQARLEHLGGVECAATPRRRASISRVTRWLLLLWLGVAACGGSKPIHPLAGAAGSSAGSAAAGSAGGGGQAPETAGTGGVSAAAGSAGAAGASGASGATVEAGAMGADDAASPDAGDDATLDAPEEVPKYGMSDGPPPCDDPHIINHCNWNETTIFPFSRRRMLLRDEGDPHVVLLDLGRSDPVVWKTVTNSPWSRGLQLIGNHQVMGSRPDGYEVFDLTTGAIVKQVQTFLNTQSAYRTANGETMLTRSGTVLAFLGKDDTLAHQISYPGFGFVRVARPTTRGTFLIPSNTVVFEGDAEGKVLWQSTGGCADPACTTSWSQIYEPRLMADGNVLLSTFFGASLDVIDKTTHKVTKQLGTKMMPNADMFKPNAFAGFQILPNGNIITANWQGHGFGMGTSGIQVIEFSIAGDVVWFFKQDPAVFSSIQDVLVIDGMDPAELHVLETSTNGTWQPVRPSAPPGPTTDPPPVAP